MFNYERKSHEYQTIRYFLKDIFIMAQIHKNIAFYSCFVHVLFSFNLCLSGIIEARFYETLFQIPQSPYVLLISLLLAAMWLRSHSFSFGYCMKKAQDGIQPACAFVVLY